MWYPFKFWRNVSYVYTCGELAARSGRSDHRYSRRFLREIERAKRRDRGFELAVPDGDWEYAGIEGWTTTPDRMFRSLTARFVSSSGTSVWVQTSRGRGGGLALLGPALDGESLLTGESVALDGRLVDVAYLEGTLDSTPEIGGFRSLDDLLR